MNSWLQGILEYRLGTTDWAHGVALRCIPTFQVKQCPCSGCTDANVKYVKVNINEVATKSEMQSDFPSSSAVDVKIHILQMQIRIFYSPSRKFRREVFFGTPCICICTFTTLQHACSAPRTKGFNPITLLMQNERSKNASTLDFYFHRLPDGITTPRDATLKTLKKTLKL